VADGLATNDIDVSMRRRRRNFILTCEIIIVVPKIVKTGERIVFVSHIWFALPTANEPGRRQGAYQEVHVIEEIVRQHIIANFYRPTTLLACSRGCRGKMCESVVGMCQNSGCRQHIS